MSFAAKECCVLNSGGGAWAFDEFASRLAKAIGVDVAQQARRFNYILHVDDLEQLRDCRSFVPPQAIRLANDKRLLAQVFSDNRVPTPETRLVDTYEEVREFVGDHGKREWCLKYPTSCGAHGHRMVKLADPEPPNWPRPFVVQEFIRRERPEVYRTYCAGNELFRWVVRRFPEGVNSSPWVAHARGARYVSLHYGPIEALDAAASALTATGLLGSFGCVDLLQDSSGRWLVLEVGTDGLSSHVDRDIGDCDLEREIEQRIAKAFWEAAQSTPATG